MGCLMVKTYVIMTNDDKSDESTVYIWRKFPNFLPCSSFLPLGCQGLAPNPLKPSTTDPGGSRAKEGPNLEVT